MADHPDVHADGITITANDAEVILSFTRTDPAVPGVSDTVERVIVARVRMARPIAEAVRGVLTQALAHKGQQPKTIVQ